MLGLTEDAVLISQEAISFYKDLLNKREEVLTKKEEFFPNYILNLLLDEDNKMLMKEIKYQEIEEALLSMKGNKVPRPGGFPAAFSQKFWNIYKNDVVVDSEESGKKGKMKKSWNSTILILILKKEEALHLDAYKPISLYNTMYNVVIKIIASRLMVITNKTIDHEQSAF